MADNFGLKIGIEGEKEFKNALRDINQAFKVLGSEMALVSSRFDKNDKSVQALTARNEVLAKSLDTQKGKIETLRAALDNASSSFGENDRRTQNWQIQLNKALAELNGLERELEENNKALRGYADAADNSAANMGDATKAADELADNVDGVGLEMTEAGRKTSIFGDVLKANLLSEAIIGGIKALGSAIAGIGKAFAGAIKDGVEYNAQMESYNASFTTMLGDQAKAQKLVNDLKKEAAATPFGMQDLAQSAQLLMSFGMSAEEAQKHMQDLGDISQGNAEKFKSLTLAFAQMSSTGKLTGQDLMQMINAGFNPLEEISRKTGKSIGELKDEMSKGAISADMVAEAFASATAEGGRFYGSMATQSKTFSGQMATLEDGVASLKGQLAEGMTNMLSGTVLPMVNGWVDELSAALAQDGIQGLLNVFGGILEEAVQFLAEQLPKAAEAASRMVISLAQGITSALPQITQAAVMLLMTLVKGIVETLPELAAAGVQMIAILVSGIAEALPELIPAIVMAVILIAKTLLNNLDKVMEAAFKIIEGLAQGLIAALPKLIEALPEVITAITDYITANLPLMVEMGIALVIQLTAGLIKAIPQLAASLPQIVAAIVIGIGKAAVSIVEIGKNIVLGLWNGIASMISWVKDKISIFVSEIVGSIKGLLGIRSPSAVFAEMGANMALGIGEGFNNNMAQVKKGMENSIPTDFAATWSQLTSNAITAWSEIVVDAQEIWSELELYFQETLEKTSSDFNTIWNGINDFALKIWSSIRGAASTIWTALLNFFIMNLNAVRVSFETVWGDIAQIADLVWQGIKTQAIAIWDSISSFLIAGWNNAKTSFETIWYGIRDTFINIWTGLKTSAAVLFNGIVNNIKAAFNIDWWSVGRNIIDGITEGVMDTARSLARAVAEAARAALDAAKSALGIRSPSQVFRDEVGLQIGAGFAQGIDNSRQRLIESMNGLVNGLKTEAKLSITGFDIEANSAAHGIKQGAGGVTQNITIISPKPLSERELAREFQNTSRKLAMGVV